MPNHVYSTIEICGDEKEIKEIQEKIKGATEDGTDMPFDCDKIIPQPQEIKDTGGAWYNWCVDNWGTKWGAYSQPKNEEIEILEPDTNSVKFMKESSSPLRIIRYPFQTAWSPLDPVVEKLSEMYPEVMIKYAYLDEGDQFAGYDYYKGGEKIAEVDMTQNGCREVEKYVTQYSYDDSFRGFNEIYQDMLEYL